MSFKITCLGGGSLYFREVLPDLIVRTELGGTEIVLYDIDAEKVERMAAMGRQLADRAGTGVRVRATVSLPDAVDGARFAISSIGGSGSDVSLGVYGSRYHALDMIIPARYGIQQVIGDTCGPAGMMAGLRAIPVYLEICRELERRSPDAILLNHSNPMAVLCRAMRKHSSVTVIGICHGVQSGIAQAARRLGVKPEELECRWIGTNHYYWFTQVRHRGRDVYPDLLEAIAGTPAGEHEQLSARLSSIHGHAIVYPDDSHILEFYPFLAQVPGGQASLSAHLVEMARTHGWDERKPSPPPASSSAEERTRFFHEYQRLLDSARLPERPDNSFLSEGIGRIITAVAAGRRELCIVNIANGGTVPNLPRPAEIEVEAVTDSAGVRALQSCDAPPVLKAMLEKRFAWHELVVDAGVTGDRRLALQALLIDEMAIWPERAAAMLDELLEASRPLLPQFFAA